MAASAPAVGGHGVNPARLPFPSLRLPVSLRLWAADGSKALEKRERESGEGVGGSGGDRRCRYRGVPTPRPLRHGRMSCTTRRWIPDKQTPS